MGTEHDGEVLVHREELLEGVSFYQLPGPALGDDIAQSPVGIVRDG